jgi:hypothetical protein
MIHPYADALDGPTLAVAVVANQAAGYPDL